MKDLKDYARKNGITLYDEGQCQFCGANVSRGVFECHENVHQVANLLDFKNPLYYETRFLSVDAMALQHCEVHGPWNNHIHLTRLHLIFEHNVRWDYVKTPQLSSLINHYKKDRREFLIPPPPAQRGELTTVDIVKTTSPVDCVNVVAKWAQSVYESFNEHHFLVASIASSFLKKFYK